MSQSGSPILDRRGQPLLRCSRCAGPITDNDVYDQGLRLPDPGESADEYIESELIDELHHVDCRGSLRAS